ncbi:MAG: hypothetical protein ABIP75_05060 [Pyrinomonadaceae bacterium]
MRFFTRSLRSLTLCMSLVSILVISLCTPFAVRAQSPEPTPVATPSPTASPSPTVNPTPSPEPTSSPTPSVTPTPEPTPHPTGSPVPGVPYQGLLNMDVLKARPTPVVPQIRAGAPSTLCSRSQPDCVSTGQGQQGRVSRSSAKAETAHGSIIAGGGRRNRILSPYLVDHETKLDSPAQAFPLGASFFDHLSLWDARNGILVVHGVSSEHHRTWYPGSPNLLNSPAVLARPALPYAEASYDDLVAGMLDPINRTGGTDPLSRNFHWGLGLVGLPGRAGLDAGLSLSYDSLVWTKDATGEFIAFDLNRGFPSPGFQLGFPVIYGPHTNSAVGVNAYLMITPNGGRVEIPPKNWTGV